MRLIDADEILYFKGKDIVGEDAYMTQKDVIDEMPTVEADVVRCKDCIYAKPFNKIWQLPIMDALVCTHWDKAEVDDNFFCGYAIKKMDEVNNGTNR